MTTFTLRVAVNGEETDTLVENDSAAWDCKLGSISMSEGGGSFTREASNALLSFDALIPLPLAPLVRTITVAVEGPFNDPAPAWWHDNGDGTYYRIVFHGNVISSKASRILQGYASFTAMSEMQGLFERRAHLAAANNTGPRALCTDLETAHSLTINNANPMIPTAADFYNLDRPDQGPASNGEWLRTVMAGTGMSIVAEWEGTITAPVLCWRTDYPWFTGGNFAIAPAWRPWEYTYPDIGTTWRDFVAQTEVNGEQGNTLSHKGYVRYSSLRHMARRPPTRIIDVSNGTRYYGTARLSDGVARRSVGNQEYSVTSWIDTAAVCEDAAKWIMRHVGEPSYMRMNRVGFSPDRLRAAADADADFSEDPDDYAMRHAVLTLGDQLSSRATGASFADDNGIGGDATTGFWPANMPVGSDGYDELNALWNPILESDGLTTPAEYHTVRAVGREWTPNGGWEMEVGLEPDALIAAAGFDLDHGTYT